MRALFGRRGIIVTFVIAGLTSGFYPFDASALAAENAALKNPYDGGIKLPSGGGDPGKTYMAIIDAGYKKDYKQLCRLISAPVDVAECLKQKEFLNGFITMFTQPKTHKVIGGFMKEDDATLNVAYTFDGGKESTGAVMMKLLEGRWIITSFGGSGEATISAEASGQANLEPMVASALSNSGKELEEIGSVIVSANREEYFGKCPVDILFSASIAFRMPPPDKISYHWERPDGTSTPEKEAKPPRNGHLSIRESWKGGKPGQEFDVALRFVVESNGYRLVKDPPSVKVTCR